MNVVKNLVLLTVQIMLYSYFNGCAYQLYAITGKLRNQCKNIIEFQLYFQNHI